MAYEIGRQRVADSDNFSDHALGLSLPLQRGNKGLFRQNFTTIDQARSNIKNLLMTRLGERVMQPNFGSGLHEIVFEQLDDDDIEDKIITAIETALETWIPYVTLGEVELDLSNSNVDRNIVGVRLTFTIGDDIDTNEVTFTIEG